MTSMYLIYSKISINKELMIKVHLDYNVNFWLIVFALSFKSEVNLVCK